MNMLTIKLLNNAINILKRDGWIQGDLHSNPGAEDFRQRGGHCAMGAIIQAADEFDGKDYTQLTPAREKAFIALAKIIDPNLSNEDYNEEYESDFSVFTAEDTIAEFNDGEAGSMKDVVEKMRAAVAAIKQGEIAV